MASVIEFADWVAMQESIKAGAQAVSGMTAAEAQAALNASATATQSGQLYIYGSQAVQAVKPPLQFPASSAAQAAGNYVSSGGLTTATGAATSTISTAQVSNMALTQTAEGATGVAGLLSMNLPTAAAAIAPLAGVALGVSLYSLAPDFWEKVSRALLPFCYEDTELLPVAVDEEGKTYYPKTAIDAVVNIISEAVETGVTSDVPGIKGFSSPLKYVTGTYVDVFDFIGATSGKHLVYTCKTNSPVRVAWFIDSTYMYAYMVSETPFEGNSGSHEVGTELSDDLIRADKTEYQGKTFYSRSALLYRNPNVNDIVPRNTFNGYSDTPNRYAFEYTILYGNESGTYPDGTSKWTGAKYPPSPEELAVISFIEDNKVFTEKYYPITTPTGKPGVTVDPEEFPDITENPDKNAAINPWITNDPDKGEYPEEVPQSKPSKLPETVPDYSPDLDPNADPSQEPEAQPEADPDPAETQKEKDEGESPNPSIPIIPTPSAAAGLLHVYNPTKSQVDEFGSWLWTTFSGDLIDTLSKLFNDPMDAVIGLHELYVTPSVTGTATIRAGYLDSGITSNLVGNRYTSINCGSIVVPEFYGNYLDYSPYTKCFIYLPFVGIVPVTADDIIGNAVNVTYNIDAYNGCCIAIVTVAREGYSSTVYQFEGNCGVEIPITSGYQSVLMGGLLGIAGTAISGSPHVGLGLASLGRANLGKNEVSRSGSFGSSYGAMGAKIPYIIVKRPTQKSVVNYNQEYGFPAHKRVLIGACEGYLRVREVHVISPTASDAEKALIERMLKEGVFVK